jgi:hypothetical protein
MIKFMEQQDIIQKSNRAKSKPQHNGNNKGGNKKRKGDFSQNNNSSKKARKHCALCDQYGGPTNTHNTTDFGIYNLDGTRKRGKSKSNGDKKTHNNFTQLLKVAQEAKKEIKDLKKDIRRLKKKRSIEKSDSGTDA